VVHWTLLDVEALWNAACRLRIALGSQEKLPGQIGTTRIPDRFNPAVAYRLDAAQGGPVFLLVKLFDQANGKACAGLRVSE
jgi:hypothetical protein